MTDREEREEHIKRLEAALACEEKQSSGKCSKQTCDDNCALLYEQGNWGEWKETLRYAINSLKIDLKYDLLYEETSGQADKTIEALEQEPNCSEIPTGSTTKNDLGVDYLGVDAISRQAINGYIDYILSHGMGKQKSFEFIKKFVANLPPVTPQLRKGRWIETAEEYYKAINEKGSGVNENTDYFTDDIACSECLAKFSVIDNEADRFDFCPNCGSDNREVEE